MNYSGKTNVSIKNLMILGGSRIGVRIATELQDELNVKLIEYNPDKATNSPKRSTGHSSSTRTDAT